MIIQIKDIEYNYKELHYQDFLFLSIKCPDTNDEWFHNLGKSSTDSQNDETVQLQLSNLQKHGLDDTFKQKK